MLGRNTNIWFVRHGESLKNIEGIHGGSGQCLTSKGIVESRKILSKIQASNIDITKSLIVGNGSRQVIETMDIFSSNLGCSSIVDNRIGGIHLGVANGLSREALKIKFPNDALMLDAWRKKEISINELKVTDMEDVRDFHSRVVDFIKTCKKDGRINTYIVVCTTSVIIMILNLMLQGKNFSFSSYYHFSVNTGDFVLAQIKNDFVLELLKTSIIIE